MYIVMIIDINSAYCFTEQPSLFTREGSAKKQADQSTAFGIQLNRQLKDMTHVLNVIIGPIIDLALFLLNKGLHAFNKQNAPSKYQTRMA